MIQGQARASADPQAEMNTILGSCVATCLFDPVARIGGMNHFLLAEPPQSARGDGFDANYGLYLMELLSYAGEGSDPDALPDVQELFEELFETFPHDDGG